MEKERISVNDVMNAIVPITRFNRGEANKIFEEVSELGFKLVLKNNTPSCVLLSPERYQEMVEQLEDYALLLEAERRMKENEGSYISHDAILRKYEVNESDLADIEVELE